MFSIEINNRQCRLAVDTDRLRRAADAIARDAGVARGTLSIAIVDDPTIHSLNRRYLDHDYPTDVLSFVLDRSGDALDGEVIVSADMALAQAEQFGWSADDELLLYAIHGTLHLVGYDDGDATAQCQMRSAEARYLALFGLGGRQPSAEALGASPRGATSEA